MRDGNTGLQHQECLLWFLESRAGKDRRHVGVGASCSYSYSDVFS